MNTVTFLPLAQQELDDAFAYYEFQQSDLGYRFIQEVMHCIELISVYPEAWTKISKRTRRCLLKTFPYSVIYQYLDDTITVVAIANLYKAPEYWISRMSDIPKN